MLLIVGTMTARFAYAAIISSFPISVLADGLPTKCNFDRYQAMLERSPFAVASEVALPAATPNFAKDLYVASAARSSDDFMVTIASNTDGAFRKYLTRKAVIDGYTIVKIKWSRKVGQTKVTISKDGQLATLSFNQMLMAQPLPNRPAGMTPPAPSQQPSFQRATGFPTANPRVGVGIQPAPRKEGQPPMARE